MMAAICAVLLSSMELVCSAPVRADMADLVVTPPDTIHMFMAGNRMINTERQIATPLFTIHADSPLWKKALAANAEHSSD